MHPGAARLAGSTLLSDCQPYYSLQLPSRFPPPFPPTPPAPGHREPPRAPRGPPGPAAQSAAAEPGPGERGVRRSGHGHSPSASSLPPSSPSGAAPTCGPRRLLGKSRPRPSQPPAPASPASACCCPRGPHGGGGGLPVHAGTLGRRGRGERGGRRRRLRQLLSWSAAAPAVAAAAPRSRYFLCGDGSVPLGPLGAGEPGGGERRRKVGAERGAAVRQLPPLRTGAGSPAQPAARVPPPPDAAARGRRCSRPAEADGRRVDGSAKAAARGIDKGDSPQRRKPLRNAVKK